jgi:hypothetical protein
MPGLDPGICGKRRGLRYLAWMAGSSPAMTMNFMSRLSTGAAMRFGTSNSPQTAISASALSGLSLRDESAADRRQGGDAEWLTTLRR